MAGHRRTSAPDLTVLRLGPRSACNKQIPRAFTSRPGSVRSKLTASDGGTLSRGSFHQRFHPPCRMHMCLIDACGSLMNQALAFGRAAEMPLSLREGTERWADSHGGQDSTSTWRSLAGFRSTRWLRAPLALCPQAGKDTDLKLSPFPWFMATSIWCLVGWCLVGWCLGVASDRRGSVRRCFHRTSHGCDGFGDPSVGQPRRRIPVSLFSWPPDSATGSVPRRERV